jgi:SWI/SNF-related matrix-associated actin-dependent regulator 1 of chromatin subfamily A
MKIETVGKYIHLTREPLEAPIQANGFLGWRIASKTQSWDVTVEDNIVNRILLGLDLGPGQPTAKNAEYIRRDSRLENYQVYDINKMFTLKSCLNRNPMGLGKTVEAITTARVLRAKSVLIVAPKIVMGQWRDQIKVWWPERAEDVFIYGATESKKRKVTSDSIVIINYEKFLNESTLNKFRQFSWHVLIADEAHRIKNPKSKRTRALKAIPAVRRYALTGTPILNKPDDLWSILHFLDWRYSGISYWNFVNYFCEVEDGFWGRKIKGLTKIPSRVETLQKLLDVISVYNTLNVAQGKTIETVRLEMTASQRKLYKDMKNLVLEELPENAQIANGAVKTIRVVQATSWPGLFLGEAEPGPKFEWIASMCEDNPDEKFVVFTRFEKSASALGEFLQTRGISSVQLTGKLKDADKEANKKQFIEGDARVLIGTIGAMGQGTDGLQYASHTAIFIDRDWSPEIMKQCEDRLNRRGQKYKVNIYILECEKSFDQYVGKVNQHKADDIREALQRDVW